MHESCIKRMSPRVVPAQSGARRYGRVRREKQIHVILPGVTRQIRASDAISEMLAQCRYSNGLNASRACVGLVG
jgi:hypothetical protein